MKTSVLDPRGETYFMHLAALGAPTFDVAVEFADEASTLFSAYRDKYGFGASEMEVGCGDIYDSQKRRVGRISYNGRIWDANDSPIE